MKFHEILLTVIVVLVVTALFTFKSQRDKNSAWKGNVVKMKVDNDDDNGRTYYRLEIQTQSGKKKINVSQEAYNMTKIGDMYEKVAGELFPKKL